MTFPVKDLIGCEYTDEGENMIEISVLPINLTNGWGCRKISNYKNTQSAKRELYSFEFNAMSRQNALNIVSTLQDLIVGKEPQSEYETLPDRRKILIFLNPFSCNGKSRRVWNNSAKAIFDKASLDYTFIETERGGQAHDFVSTEDLDQFESIVTVSGDGLIHEVVNGLLQREDKYYERRKIPIGALPGGSSNGFVKTLTYESGESSGVEQA
eukprot:CAMPEP_0197009692 /NCGR_PEP_ID=MMETSP1380-20130617/51123_1 /TAXON_ID=5936 /ORGANISM="Euplotes crassus, Strain CT5" /LENGTH=211 /DNA_ID=CAMNT_0042431103 /DNA_START=219 /DNA_END=854 /DNA_ORIENTATION=+